ncbi:MAG: protein phosphatase 2C domain-containing protein, partial [Deltaproteobacteria bacterium]|nr:protein phosphatase 2C domain-containing protein [Deltaproteobacteria bacterium]
GKPRDDSFFFDHDEESGCTFVAVADGAGSVRFSRQGSTIACQYASEMAKNYLTNKAIVDRSAKTS